jgi:hypothetical protein
MEVVPMAIIAIGFPTDFPSVEFAEVDDATE